MNKAHALLFALMMMTVSLAGCFGGDDGDLNDETPTETLDDWQVHFAASSSDLPECNDDTNGRLYYIEADGEFQVCTTSGWEVIVIIGEDGANGINGKSGTSILINIKNSTSCPTGRNAFEMGSDSNSDGVLDISEVGITVDICDGSQGPPGPSGTDGTNGADALNTLVASKLESAGNNCANGGIRIDVGVDDNADGVMVSTEIEQTQYVCNVGYSNATTLTSVTSPPLNMNCDAGGRIVSYGLDNGDGGGINSNGVLETGEIDVSTTFCSRWVPGLVRDIASGSNSALGQDGQIYSLEVGNTLYFNADDGIHGNELWKSDGTTMGTVMVKDISNNSGHGNIGHLTAIGNTVYLSGVGGLWKSNGTANGTVMVKDYYSGYVSDLIAINNTLYFTADDGIHGKELWKSDGTSNGTVMIKDINNGGSTSNPFGLTAVGSVVYFGAWDGATYTYTMWKSNGTLNGTVMVSTNAMSPMDFTAIGNTVYFTASDYGTNGRELWKTDGTTNGTVMVKDINGGSEDGVTSDMIAVGTTLYFNADDGIHGHELWKSDGTNNGTVMIKNINRGNSSGSPHNFVVVNNTLYFAADDGSSGSELWKSDGTSNGTLMVKDLNNGSTSGSPHNFVVVNNTLYFAANDGIHGKELWKSDGTSNGSIMVYDLNRGASSSDPHRITALGSRITFFALHETRGHELFITNFEVIQLITYS